jgi:ABC-type Fe3+/spermidine/putrescine transport system ATPase subunit
MSAALQLQGVSFARDGHVLLEGVDLQVDEGSTLALTGPSGSGKTTLLRTILGLEVPSQGTIAVMGRTASTAGRIHVPAEDRRIAIVFQDLGLWPHLSVGDHLNFALSAQRIPKADRVARVDRMLQSVGLEGRARQRPATLSGGERQRLAIARALVTEPSIILLDEPFSNLDIVLKQELVALLAGLLTQRQIAGILVSHDLEEALPLTKDFAVLEGGRIVQRGTMVELARSPRTPFVRALVTHTQRDRQ